MLIRIGNDSWKARRRGQGFRVLYVQTAAWDFCQTRCGFEGTLP